MGKTKIKTIDDSAQEENKESRIKSKASTRPSFGGKKVAKTAKSSAVEQTTPVIPTLSEVEGEESSASNKQIATLSFDKLRTPRNDEKKEKKEPQKPGKTKPRSKKYQEAVKDLDRTKTYPIPEAVDLVKKLSYAKFNATLEAHVNTAQTGIRGFLSLPYADGRKLRILVFGHLPEPSEYEGISFGDDSTIEEINKGKVDFDLVITTPQWMPKLTKVAKVLGPKGLMPNPKNGTIISPSADGLKKAVESFQAGKTEYKTEAKAPVIHLGLGKLNQPTEQLSANIKTLLQTLGKSKVKKVSLSPTMGPSVKVDLTSV